MWALAQGFGKTEEEVLDHLIESARLLMLTDVEPSVRETLDSRCATWARRKYALEDEAAGLLEPEPATPLLRKLDQDFATDFAPSPAQEQDAARMAKTNTLHLLTSGTQRSTAHCFLEALT